MNKRDFIMICSQDDYNQILELLEKYKIEIPCFKKDIEVHFIFYCSATNTFRFKADAETNSAIDNRIMATIPIFDIIIFTRYAGIDEMILEYIQYHN
jgi:hypothetical protein